MTYVKPQLQVFQEFRQAPQAVVRNLNAFIFGANYQLFRYAEAAEKALIGVGAYDKDNPTTGFKFFQPRKIQTANTDDGKCAICQKYGTF